MVESMMSILCLSADVVGLGNWFTLSKFPTLNVAVLTMLLHLSKFGLGLSLDVGSVADILNTGAMASTSAEHAP